MREEAAQRLTLLQEEWDLTLSMALHLYRRHNRECEAGRPKDFRSGAVNLCGFVLWR